MCQFKCLLAWCKRTAGSPLFDFVFSRGGGQREGCIDPDTGISPCANRMGKQWYIIMQSVGELCLPICSWSINISFESRSTSLKRNVRRMWSFLVIPFNSLWFLLLCLGCVILGIYSQLTAPNRVGYVPNLCKIKSDFCNCLLLPTAKGFRLQVYSWHLYNTSYMPIIHYIQHWLIVHKLRVISGIDGPAPTQPLSRANEI